MISRPLLVTASLLLLIGVVSAAGGINTNSWSLASPNGQCAISVSLGDDKNLSYRVSRAGKMVIKASPLGLRRDDGDFEHALVFDHAEKIKARRETYELFAGTQPQVDHILNHRTLWFRATNNVPMEIELAAGDEGVAFRYRFPETDREVRVARIRVDRLCLAIRGAAAGCNRITPPDPTRPLMRIFFFTLPPATRRPIRARRPGVGLSPRSFTFQRRRLGAADRVGHGRVLLRVPFGAGFSRRRLSDCFSAGRRNHARLHEQVCARTRFTLRLGRCRGGSS